MSIVFTSLCGYGACMNVVELQVGTAQPRVVGANNGFVVPRLPDHAGNAQRAEIAKALAKEAKNAALAKALKDFASHDPITINNLYNEAFGRGCGEARAADMRGALAAVQAYAALQAAGEAKKQAEENKKRAAYESQKDMNRYIESLAVWYEAERPKYAPGEAYKLANVVREQLVIASDGLVKAKKLDERGRQKWVDAHFNAVKQCVHTIRVKQVSSNVKALQDRYVQSVRQARSNRDQLNLLGQQLEQGLQQEGEKLRQLRVIGDSRENVDRWIDDCIRALVPVVCADSKVTVAPTP
jgi:hypothetical protein